MKPEKKESALLPPLTFRQTLTASPSHCLAGEKTDPDRESLCWVRIRPSSSVWQTVWKRKTKVQFLLRFLDVVLRFEIVAIFTAPWSSRYAEIKFGQQNGDLPSFKKGCQPASKSSSSHSRQVQLKWILSSAVSTSLTKEET